MKTEIYDTTLRDGSQQEGISLTVGDKLRIASLLDELGVDFVEGGWPGANPKDDEFFRRAQTELDFDTATLVAFGSTRRPRGSVADDPQLQALLAAGTEIICIVGKSWDYHVREALRMRALSGWVTVLAALVLLSGCGREAYLVDDVDQTVGQSFAEAIGAIISAALAPDPFDDGYSPERDELHQPYVVGATVAEGTALMSL